ncbi:hypothetical protein [Nitratireductor thuwali]|uniref:DUF3035 domain-containing protein n=1 Tax=Nitratireductor thuwali TaxID=2267699 RepID=A0ABY5MMJ7_9HYPH|nr:hypothetical protein NTH_03002 [Nitratireductor thuwali]
MTSVKGGITVLARGPRGTRIVAVAGVFSAILLTGCGGPTYGTGTPSSQQLVEDVTGALSLAPKNKTAIAYEPRPGIVQPASDEVLPPPQEDVTSAANPAWPESPEERLARIRAEATANQDNPLYRPNIVRDVDVSEPGRTSPIAVYARQSSAERRAEFLRRQKMTKQGSPTTRRYLSEPPTEYRQPVETAPVGELGEDEWKKERQAKKAAGSGTGGIRSLLPWLN